ncbi:MAG: ATP synthase F1 subunit epsilon [Bacteroidota bacterium]
MNVFQLEIVTPEGKAFEGTVEKATVPGIEGSFQVLFNHAPIISTLGKGVVKVETEAGKSLSYAIEDGVAEVLNNKMVVLVESLRETTV